MFETLDAIDWPQIANCSGLSGAIPAAIRELVSDDLDRRHNALDMLWNLLEDQGVVSHASALSVPFLLEILADSRTQDKYQLVQFMVLLGSQGAYLGKRYQSLQERLTLQRIKEGETNEFIREMKQTSAIWRKETHEAFRKGLPLFLSMLADSDSAIRAEIAFLLAVFKEDHALLLPALMRQLEAEKDEYVQCSLLLCLGELSVPTGDVSQLLQQYVMMGETALLQFTAARAVCALLKEETPERVVHILLSAFANPFSLQSAYEHLLCHWGSGGVDAMALYYLDQLTSSAYQELIIYRLLEVFPIVVFPMDLDCVDLLLRVTFYEKNFQFQQDMTFDDLDYMQQIVLRIIVSKESFWADGPPLIRSKEDFGASDTSFWDEFLLEGITPAPVSIWTLNYLGLPSTFQGLRAFIEKEE